MVCSQIACMRVERTIGRYPRPLRIERLRCDARERIVRRDRLACVRCDARSPTDDCCEVLLRRREMRMLRPKALEDGDRAFEQISRFSVCSPLGE